MSRTEPRRRDAYPAFHAIETRWHDNDVYGHVNNVVYYAYFDTAVNHFLVARGLLDVAASPVIGIVAETACRFFASLAFPDRVNVGLAVTRLGRSSVRYALGIFRNDDASAAAEGDFVHVYVDRATMRPVPIPEATRQALAELLVENHQA